MTSEARADVRDMYMAHTTFRREFRLAPGLVRGVPAGDVERAGVVADHLGLVEGMLMHHHQAEDKHIWPRLLERAGSDAAPIVTVMEQQHETLDVALETTRELLHTWAGTADPAHGTALAEALERLVPPLVEHLAVEEETAVPLIEEYITATEWQQTVADGAEGVDPEQMPLLLGMMMYEGDPDTVRDVIAGLPPEIGPVMAELAPAAWAGYAEQVYGTATPEQVGKP